MKTAGLWLHGWDVWSDGVEQVMAYARDAGLTCLYPASAYHSGWFIHPHSRGRRVWMPEDGVIYFRPQEEVWASSRVKPRVASLCVDLDAFAAASERLDEYGLSLSAWTVCCHNTALGLAHPELTVRNCFGDSYPHALCPSHPDVRAYLAALVRDLATAYPLRSVQLEAPGYLGFRHGHHHERHSVPLDAVATRLMDLSFAPSDLALAAAAGIDGEGLREDVAELLESYLNLAPERPAGWPLTTTELAEQWTGLAAYQGCLDWATAELVQLLRAQLEGTGTRLEGFGLGEGYDIVTIGAYGAKPEAIAERVRSARQRQGPSCELQVGLRPGFGDVASAGELGELVAACDEAGAEGVVFYNYSEMSRTNLSWLGPALAGRVSR